MRKLKLQVQMSIDGYIASTQGKTDWMVWNWSKEWTWDEALRKDFNDLTASVDCILLSRKMAEEGFIAHWTRVAENPGDPQAAFAKSITEAHKVVFTRTLDKSIWNNTDLASGDLAAEVNKLKNQQGRDIIAYGGATFASALINAGLIDEFYLFINPVALGEGMTIFNNGKLNLTLVKSTFYDCGMTVLKYLPLKD